MTAGFGMVTNALTKILGAQVLRDLQTFVAALDTVFGGFRQRAQKTYALLQADGTAFLVVAAPEPDALREAAYFVERLSEDRMPLAGLVVNRASPAPGGDALAPTRRWPAAARLRKRDAGARSPPGCCGCTPTRRRLVEREALLRDRFAAAHPQVPTAVVPALAGDVHDLDGLRRIGDAAGRSGQPGRRAVRRAIRRDDRSTGQAERRGARLASRAVSRTARQEAFGRRRSSARRSRSVMPPQTPHSIWLSSASARHSVRTGQPAHSCLALFCSAPRTNSSSGCSLRQAARGAQSSTHMMLSPHHREQVGVPMTRHSKSSRAGKGKDWSRSGDRLVRLNLSSPK